MSLKKRIAVIIVLLLCIVVGASAQEGGGLFGRGVATGEMENEEGYYAYYGYRGGLFYSPYYGEYGIGYIIGTQIFGSDVYGGYNIFTQQFGQEETPLDGGWLVLTTAGALYAFKKRKNNHKK